MRALFILMLASHTVFAQGPWSEGRNGGYFQLMHTALPAYNTLYIKNGDPQDTQRKLKNQTIAAYLKYSVSEEFTLNLNVPVVIVGAGAVSNASITPIYEEGSLKSLGNISAAGKFTYVNRKLVSAFIMEVEFPNAAELPNTGFRTGVNAVTIMPKVSVGASSDKWFAHANLGYGYRDNNYDHIIDSSLEFGFYLTNNMQLIVNLHSKNQLNNGTFLEDPKNRQTGFYTSDQEYQAFLLKLFRERLLHNFGAIASVGGGKGNMVAISPAISFGVFYQWESSRSATKGN